MSVDFELKARASDPARLAARLEELGGEARRGERQEDVYFDVDRGRLKLRTGSRTGHTLIAYHRLDSPLIRENEHERLELGEGQAQRLRSMLEVGIGSRAVVAKNRSTWELGAARVHLDEIDELGGFVEVAVSSELSPSSAEARALADRLSRIWASRPPTWSPGPTRTFW